jgi:hypothetical protein
LPGLFRGARHWLVLQTKADYLILQLDDASRLALAVVRPGDLVVTLGVGEPWRAARAIVDGLPGASRAC